MRTLLLVTACWASLLSGAYAADLTPAEIYKNAVGSVFALTAVSGSGQLSVASGFAVAPNLVVTSYHAVDDASTILLKPVEGNQAARKGKLIASDPQNDIAIISVPGQPAKPLLIDGGLPAIGETVLSIGSPEGLAGSLTAGMVSGHRFIRGRELIQMNAPVEHGNSGGPVIGPDGRVVGVLHARVSERSSIGFANPAKFLLPLLGDQAGYKSEPVQADRVADAGTYSAPDMKNVEKLSARAGTQAGLRPEEPLLHMSLPDDPPLMNVRTSTGSDRKNRVVIGVGNWDSANAVAHILATLIEERTDHSVELVTGSLDDLWDKFRSGEVDIISEFWLPNNKSFFAEVGEYPSWGAVSKPIYNAVQGTCTTRRTQAQLGLYDLRQLADPEMARHFDADADGWGEIWIGQDGWGATAMERVKARDYGYAETMELGIYSEAEAKRQIIEGLRTGKHMVFYCYAPNQITANQDVVLLNEEPHAPECFRFNGTSDKDWFEKSHITCRAPRESVFLFVAEHLSQTDSVLFEEVLSGFELPVGMIGEWLERIETFDHYKSDPEKFTLRWVDAHANIVPEFLSCTMDC